MIRGVWNRKTVEILLRFLRSVRSETCDGVDLEHCYRLLLGRTPDASGWNDWMARIADGLSRQELVDAFLASDEYRERNLAGRYDWVVLEGMRLCVDTRDPYVGRPLQQTGTYEPHVTSCLKRRFRPGMTFLDVGAKIYKRRSSITALFRRS